MKYAILKDGYPRYAPRSVTMGGWQIVNPMEETLRELGYLPVVETPAPEMTEPGYMPQSYWKEQNGQIIQVWEIVPAPPDPEPSYDQLKQENVEQKEALKILGVNVNE